MTTPFVLTMGVLSATLGQLSRGYSVVSSGSVLTAGSYLKDPQCCLLIVQFDSIREDDVVWIKRIKTAKPGLPVVALLNNGPNPQQVEGLLRTGGTTAVFGADTDELHTWLAEWWLRKEK